MIKKLSTLALPIALSFTAYSALAVDTKVIVIDNSFDTAGAMLAYTEFELSGEPLAETLGLDLDMLDPNAIDVPTAFDYVTGIESYEYSEEAMYALNFQSRMGPHLANGLANKQRGGTSESLQQRFSELARSVGFDSNDLPKNMYPVGVPYVSGTPEFAQKVNVTKNGEETLTIDDKEIKAITPAYVGDFTTLAWEESGMDKHFNPAAFGGQMLKDVMWTQDFLGGMHVIESDEEVEAESTTQDQDGIHALGVSAADGVNGMLLAELTWDKLLTIKTKLGYNGKELGTPIITNYSPKEGPIWLPHSIKISEKVHNGFKGIGALKVTDSTSSLRDKWLLLWPLSEFYAMTDQRTANTNQNPAFLAVYDGAPFPKAPAENIDDYLENDIESDDPFSLASALTNAQFKNLISLHFNKEKGTFVDVYTNGKKGNIVTAYDAAYALHALSIYQRSQDALPVGYASADSGESLNTERGKKALDVIRQQADFILANLIGKNGLVANKYEIGKGILAGNSVGTQFAVIHGLSSAFKATGDMKYRKAARTLFVAVEKNLFDPQTGVYANKDGIYTPWTVAAVSAGMRSLMTVLPNTEKESEPLLTLQHLTSRYKDWFRTVINGHKVGEGMQLAEWPTDTGENIISDDVIDSDGDNVARISRAGASYGFAPVMAAKVRITQ